MASAFCAITLSQAATCRSSRGATIFRKILRFTCRVRSPAYIGSAAGFLTGDDALRSFGRLSETVRAGARVSHDDDAPPASYWRGFAESMASFAEPVARMAAACVTIDVDQPMKILDVAAGHGQYGIAMAARSPNASVFALDHPVVLEVAERNARRAGCADRYNLIPGDVFEVELGGPYDLIVAANLAHHFDKATNTGLFRRLRAALAPTGQLVLVDFVPNEDRVSPAIDAAFALNMLATTPDGDTYTFAEFDRMLTDAGFHRDLPAGCRRPSSLGDHCVAPIARALSPRRQSERSRS